MLVQDLYEKVQGFTLLRHQLAAILLCDNKKSHFTPHTHTNTHAPAILKGWSYCELHWSTVDGGHDSLSLHSTSEILLNNPYRHQEADSRTRIRGAP